MFENFNPFNRITDCIYFKKKIFQNSPNYAFTE